MRAAPMLRYIAIVTTALAGVVAATALVAALEHGLAVPNAAAVYLVAVAAVAIAVGTGGAVLAAVVAVLGYDFLFTEPLHTLTVSDPGELLDLVVLLIVAVTVGQLASIQRGRAEEARAHEQEARALVEVSSLLAGRTSVAATLPAIAAILARDPATSRVWINLGPDDAAEQTVADTGTGDPPARTPGFAVLHRHGAGREASWTQIRAAGPSREGPVLPGVTSRERRFRVRIEAGGRVHGSIWITRRPGARAPGGSASRLLATAAEQIGQALEHDRLESEARLAEIVRRSDRLKSALLDSVSHDLRTPLASIRAYAGTLMDEEVHLSPADARASAGAIDREAQRLNRIVTNLLDLSRIEGGALRARLEVVDIEDVVRRAVEEVRPRLGDRSLEVAVTDELAVMADPVLLDVVLVNLLENAVTHTPAGTRIVIRGQPLGDGRIGLTVEDSGRGVPAPALPRLFEPFFQVGAAGAPGASGSRGPVAGTGIGLAVVRGLIAALGGEVSARSSRLGGLAVDLVLPAPEETVPAEPPEGTAPREGTAREGTAPRASLATGPRGRP